MRLLLRLKTCIQRWWRGECTSCGAVKRVEEVYHSWSNYEGEPFTTIIRTCPNGCDTAA